ncbi:hypothetical protein FRC20_002395 [Serendipita sp. 405]|nr:hypothetical protein FRC20_002395 [Serendipita sp. 405]
MMMFAWVSATNCSRIYNTALGDKDGLRELGLQWKNVMKMDMENVWEAFHIHSLLIDQISLGEFHSQNQPLSLPHKDATQRLDRFVGALQARNIRFSDYHRPHYNHVCDGCSKVVERDGTMSLIRSAVTDGVTLGRPCCAVHDCKGSLSSPKRRYCPDHQELEGICATIGCDNPIRPGFKTCNRPECIQVEELYKEEGLAMKKFKERLERQKGHISVVHDPLLTAALGFTTDGQVDSVQPDDEVEVEIMSGSHPEDGMDIDKSGKEPQARATCTGKSDGHQKRLKARFGRKRTFCEELVVLSCGIVIGRTTFYGSEAPNGVVTFWEHLFPTPQSVPTFMWYDNNCHVKKILRNEPEHRLNQVALPVDVFHFKTKHKDNDKFCGEHCNPILWPELRDGDKWTFNSSAAEQVNAWIGGFLAMVREMREENCAFFLDEMLRRRNEYRIGELDRKGMQPKHINMDILMEGWDGYSPL